MSETVAAVRPSFSLKFLIPGLAASLLLGMWQMMAEALLPGGAGFWGPPVYIAAALLRDLQAAAAPVAFHAAGVMLGLAIHMMISAMLGAAFALLVAPRVASFAGRVGGGAAFGLLVFAAMWLVGLPLADPAMLRLSAAAFLLGHLMWGAALGALHHRLVGEG